MWRGVFYSIKRGKGQKRCGGKVNFSWLFTLRGKGELQLAFSAAVGDRSLALRLEYRIKQLTKRQKERLVTGDGSFEALRESLIKSD